MPLLRNAATLIALFLAGCAYMQQDELFWSGVGNPPEGLSREEVTARLGEPTRVERSETGEILWYEDNASRRLRQGRDYFFVLQEGKVASHGAKPSRTFPERVASLGIGMSREDAVRIMGQPDAMETEGVREVLVYLGCTSYLRFGDSQPVDYHVTFEDGALVKKAFVYRRGFENPPSFVSPGLGGTQDGAAK